MSLTTPYPADLLVVAQKVVSKVEDRARRLDDVVRRSVR